MSKQPRKRRLKRARRLGHALDVLSGVRSIESKCKFDTLPGMHAKQGARLSEYGKQLQEKQKAQLIYNIRTETQFREIYKKASRRKESTGEYMLQLLERRLDNIVYRSGFASTRAEARQLINHGAILVDGKRVKSRSTTLKKGQKIQISEKGQKQDRIKLAIDLAQQREDSEWLKIDYKKMESEVISIPEGALLPQDINVHLIVELYSK